MTIQQRLGKVYLLTQGLDKKRFKELIEDHKTLDTGIDISLDEYPIVFNDSNGYWQGFSELASMHEDYSKITLDELEQTIAELKAVEFAESVNWDFDRIKEFIDYTLELKLYVKIDGSYSRGKTKYIIDKYKPKDEFPEVWCIRQDASEIVCKWFNEKFRTTAFTGGSYKYLCNKSGSNFHFSDTIVGTEITFEQFKKHVMKTEIKVGDVVKVVRPGQAYTTHPDREELGFIKVNTPSWEKGRTGTVFNIGKVNVDCPVACLRDEDGNELLIGTVGVELVQSPKNTLKVTREQLSEIYPKVCSGWQNKIDMILDKFSNEFTVSESLLKEARSEADTDDQKEWLNKVFGKEQLPKMELTHYMDSTTNDWKVYKGSISKIWNYKLIMSLNSHVDLILRTEKQGGDEYLFKGKWNEGRI